MTSAPIFLYEITRNGTVSRLAGWGIDVEAGGETWLASDITNGGIVSGIEIIGETVEIELATDDDTHPFRESTDAFANPADVRIFEVDANELTIDEDAPFYVGQVDEVSFGEAGRIKVKLSSIERIAEESGPRIQIQRTCHHDVYDTGCGLTAATFTTVGTIDAISESPAYVEASEFDTKATAEAEPQWFALGRVICGDEIRFCVGQVGARLYLNLPFRNASVSDAISALAGCDKRINSGCAKLENTERFLGFPYLPNANPQFEALKEPEVEGGKK